MNAPLAPGKFDLSRRALIFSGLSAAGGLAIGMPLPAAAAELAKKVLISDGINTLPELSAFLIIDPDNSITVRVPHQEMGQGTATALAMLVAEELDCAWSDVKVEYASANRNARAGGKLYGNMTTVGSRGVRTSVAMMQQAGASARERLRMAAAQHWKVDAAECSVQSGKCLHKTSNEMLTYGDLAPAAALIKLDAEPAIKTPDKYKFVGKWTPRLDTAPKLNGSAQFGIDVVLPDMVYAAVISCPEFGGTLASLDETPIQGMRGVIAVVKMDDAVAVAADRYWRAKAALAKLKPVWASGGNNTVDQAQLDKAYIDALDGPLVTARNDGDAKSIIEAPGAKVIEALYEAPNLAHAPMEPLNATVHLQPNRVDVWIGTQGPPGVLAMAAKATGVAPENVYVHNQFLGGGFGRRTQHDELLHAIAVAKVVNKPVKLIWSREQDIRRDRYRPQAAARFRAVMKDGKPIALNTDVAVGSLLRSLGISKVENGVEPTAIEVLDNKSYAIPNQHIGLMLKNSHVPVMFWRSVGASQNTFFKECFIDELAHEAGKDPYKFRRELLQERPDYLAVLDMLAKKSNWGKPLPKGSGRGIAIMDDYGSVAGGVCEVTVSKDGKIKIDHYTAVTNCYHAVNPNTIDQQIAGGVIMGLTAALYGEIRMKNGAPIEGNFNTYPLMRMNETPPFETHLALTEGKEFGGIGEPYTAPAAPALCNAIFAATGKRVRKLPLKHADLSWT